MNGIILISLIIGGVSWYVSSTLQRRFKEYSQMPIRFTGKEIAEKMLRDNGITDVQVISVPGALTDHYNPLDKTVNLSDWVYAQSNVAAAAVAAHECGHAVQHSTAYSWLTMRSKLVPVVQVSSQYVQWVILAGLGVLMFTKSPWVLLIGIILFATTTLFSFITLPVEFDASSRALKWLDSTQILMGEEHDKAKNALKWAASTYVVAALGSLVTLLYYISIFVGARRRD
ncbi:MAG TPA: zinc metallopeptidase [Chitinophagales bacterium]|jgi:Zn-dependent membrane protease YugP|nr:zinc metallopeptidase [Chitinophagales bacterium]MBP6153607.1 zinc metallopeptidase [Chitinophagales bacterium]HQV77894.1 zinc metallopeptidase [Chitinophagales bacterium]HQW78615.1 zinc metallopeptidase [Chitinophagales bacterium]HRB66493.1 zinc metallopeptidase [Chitinophagales bacterium]